MYFVKINNDLDSSSISNKKMFTLESLAIAVCETPNFLSVNLPVGFLSPRVVSFKIES